jgi:hypothetical protein
MDASLISADRVGISLAGTDDLIDKDDLEICQSNKGGRGSSS